ncbi:MAG TPA: hypothetical protein DEF79_00555 [Gammaproteobacteria bacterium]|nr:hypothetical protein [Gammaproteobacteria bacterium]
MDRQTRTYGASSLFRILDWASITLTSVNLVHLKPLIAKEDKKMNSTFAQDTFNAAMEIWRDRSATQEAPEEHVVRLKFTVLKTFSYSLVCSRLLWRQI